MAGLTSGISMTQGMRADFHARVLTGMIKMGYDRLADIPAAVHV